MLVREENCNILVRISGKDFADLVERFPGDYHFSGRIGIFQVDFADRNAVSVKGDHSEHVSIDFKKLSAHQFIVVIV